MHFLEKFGGKNNGEEGEYEGKSWFSTCLSLSSRWWRVRAWGLSLGPALWTSPHSPSFPPSTSFRSKQNNLIMSQRAEFVYET